MENEEFTFEVHIIIFCFVSFFGSIVGKTNKKGIG